MRTWLVTGASKGLGEAIARVALRNGERVAVGCRRVSDAAPFAAEFPETVLPVSLDVTDPGSVQNAVEAVRSWGGGVDVLVNNAGQGLHGAIEEASDAEIRRLFDVNLFGAIEVLRQVLPGMRARRAGRIINIGSVAGFVANPGTGVYCATKFALEAVSEALRKEVAGLGIKVSVAAPGGMRTSFNGASIWRSGLEIADYADSAGARIAELRQRAGSSGSDVGRAAEAIWELSLEQDPPPHLILGADAIERIASKLELLQEGLRRARPLDDHAAAATE